jgi:hypothetical protein
MRVRVSDDAMSQRSRDQTQRESLASYTLGDLSSRVTTNPLIVSSEDRGQRDLVWRRSGTGNCRAPERHHQETRVHRIRPEVLRKCFLLCCNRARKL